MAKKKLPARMIPKDPEGLYAALEDQRILNEIGSDVDSLHEFIQGYADNFHGDPSNEGVNEQIRMQAEKQAFAMLRNGGVEHVDMRRMGALDVDPTVRANQLRSFTNSIKAHEYNKRAVGAVAGLDIDVFGTAGQFFSDLAAHQSGEATQEQRSRINKYIEVRDKVLRNTLGETSPASGGFIVPERLRADIMTLALQMAIARPRATVMPMDSLTLAVPGIDETTHVGSVYGGMTAGWYEEGAPINLTEPKFQRVLLQAHKLAWAAVVNNELLADAPALNTWIERRVPGMMNWFEDREFLKGDGVGKPLGVLNAPGRVTVTRTADDVVRFADIIAMLARMLPQSLPNAVWLASQNTIPSILEMIRPISDSGSQTGTIVGGSDLIVKVNNIGQITIFGRPVIFNEFSRPVNGTPANSEGSLALVDFTEYLIGDRMVMQLRASEHIRFDRDQTMFRGINRSDGRPWISTPITPENGGDTLSPYVVLSANAA